MAQINENGFANTQGAFTLLIAGCTDYGTAYNPAHPSLSLTALQAINANAVAALTAVNAILPVYNGARNARRTYFDGLNGLVTRITGAAKGCRLPDATLKNIAHWTKKIKGTRLTAAVAAAEDAKSVSTSQQSYDMRIDFLDKLIAELETAPDYVPNETDLQTAALRTFYQALNTANNTVKTNTYPIVTARANRDTVFFAPMTGLVDTAHATKEYLKSINGTKDARYQKLKSLSFRGR